MENFQFKSSKIDKIFILTYELFIYVMISSIIIYLAIEIYKLSISIWLNIMLNLLLLLFSFNFIRNSLKKLTVINILIDEDEKIITFDYIAIPLLKIEKSVRIPFRYFNMKEEIIVSKGGARTVLIIEFNNKVYNIDKRYFTNENFQLIKQELLKYVPTEVKDGKIE